LTVSSEIKLPELVTREPSPVEPDVRIRLGQVPEDLPGASRASPESQIDRDTLLLTIPEVGRYRVADGRLIVVEPLPEAKDHNVRLFILGSALGAIYLQRNLFPLHASVVVINGQAVAFSGDSGSGKSSMAAWMNLQGYPLLCDDVCVIRFDQYNQPLAYPGYPRLKLWKDTLDTLDISQDNLQRDHFRADKFHLPMTGSFWAMPVRLRYLNFLRFSEPGAKTTLTRINPPQAVPLLRNNTYRYQYISGLELTESHFKDCVSLARQVSTCYLDRPRREESFSECQRLVEQQVS